jgi:hypothetical protein
MTWIWYIYILGGLIGVFYFKKKYNLSLWKAISSGFVFAVGLYFTWGTIAVLFVLILGLEEVSSTLLIGLFLYPLLAFGNFKILSRLKNQKKANASANKDKKIKPSNHYSNSITKYKPGDTVETSLAGVTYRSRQNRLKTLHIGQSVNLRREPRNKYDSNAILVTVGDNKSIGYINRDLAEILAPFFDNAQNISSVKGKISSIYQVKNEPPIIGVKIRFQIPLIS